MIKRASTILLTLFLLLTSAVSVLAQTPVWADPAGKTNYKVNGATALNEVNILNPLYESSSTSCRFSISSNGLKITSTKGENKFKYTFSGVASNATDKKCTVTIKLGSSTNAKYRIVTTNASGNEDYSMSYDYHGGGTKTITTYAKGTSASIRIDFDEDNQTFLIEEISIKCQILPQIIIPAVFMGEEATFTAAGLTNPVTWYYQEKGKTTWKEIGSGQSVTTLDVKDNGKIKAVDGTGKEYIENVFVTIRCNGTLTPDFKETFKINKDKGVKNDIVPTSLNGSSRFDTNYNPYTRGSDPEAADEEEYMIVKNTDNTFEGWEIGNSSLGTPLKGHSDDGFMIINCNTVSINDGEDKYIFKLDIGNLCKYTRYNFSAYIMNVCQENTEREPINVLFRVYGLDNSGNQSPEPLLNLPTGDIANPDTTWYQHKGSVYTEGYTSVRLLLYNNNTDAELSSGKVIGNDVGIDDIEFSRCTPEVGVYTENPSTTPNAKTTIEKCNNGNETVTLYIGNPEYSLNHFMEDAYYVLQQKEGSGNWTTVKDASGNDVVLSNSGYAKYQVNIVSGQADTQYRGIVASSESAARELITSDTPSNSTGNACVSYYKMSGNFALVKMKCTNSSMPPILEDFSSCAPEDGKFDLYNTITKINLSDGSYEDVSNLDLAAKKAKIATLGTIEWFKEDNTPSPSVIDFPRSSDNPGKYYAKFTQKDPSIVYSISGNSDVASVSLLETITFDVTPLAGYKGCISEIEDEHSFEIENIKPTESATGDYKFTWMSVNEDGSFNEANPLQTSGTTYELPLVSGKGKIVVKAVSNSDAACPGISDPVEYDLAADPKFEYVGANIPCKDQLKEDGVVINLKDISGSTQLKIKRTATDENNKVSETIFTSFDKTDAFKVINLNDGDTEYAFKDTYFDAQYFSADFDANKIAFVQYDIVLGIETTECKVKYSTETFGISSTNVFSLIPSINVVDINKSDNIVDFHVCEGELVTVESNYNAPSGLKAGEIYKWYVNDVLVEGDEAANSKSYTIDKIEETTTIKVELDKDPKVTDAKTCGGSATITINVDKMPKIESNDVYICEDDEDGIQLSVSGGDSYAWSPSTGLSATNISNPTAKVSKTTTYAVDVFKGQCKNDTTVVVNVNNLPEITSIEPVSEEEQGNMVVSIVKEVGDTYSYSLDGDNYTELPLDNIIKDLPIGWSLLYIKNDSTTCVNSKEFYIAPIEIKPAKFFTPNGDGENEKWTVKNLDAYDSYIVEIFDRYGKRLYIKRVGSFNIGASSEDVSEAFEGWEGDYNGHPMPSDDYWYLITVEEIRKQYTGHFTLKR